MEAIAKLIESVARLIGVLTWPAIILVLIFQFGGSIREFISNIGEGSFKGFGFEAFAKRKTEVVAAIVAAQVRSDVKSNLEDASALNSDSSKISDSIVDSEKIITERTFKSLKNKNILWVDDNPKNNIYERKAFRALGVRIWSVRSTAEALNLVEEGNDFDVIITDIARPEGQLAGYDLISKLRNVGCSTPIIIYSNSNTPEQALMAKRNGAFGSTTDAGRLVELVSNALIPKSSRG